MLGVRVFPRGPALILVAVSLWFCDQCCVTHESELQSMGPFKMLSTWPETLLLLSQLSLKQSKLGWVASAHPPHPTWLFPWRVIGFQGPRWEQSMSCILRVLGSRRLAAHSVLFSEDSWPLALVRWAFRRLAPTPDPSSFLVFHDLPISMRQPHSFLSCLFKLIHCDVLSHNRCCQSICQSPYHRDPVLI